MVLTPDDRILEGAAQMLSHLGQQSLARKVWGVLEARRVEYGEPGFGDYQKEKHRKPGHRLIRLITYSYVGDVDFVHHGYCECGTHMGGKVSENQLLRSHADHAYAKSASVKFTETDGTWLERMPSVVPRAEPGELGKLTFETFRSWSKNLVPGGYEAIFVNEDWEDLPPDLRRAFEAAEIAVRAHEGSLMARDMMAPPVHDDDPCGDGSEVEGAK